MSVTVVVLAAGQGKRMHSDLPKVLHRVADKPMIEHVLDTAARLSGAPPVVVYGHGGNTLVDALAHRDVVWAEQSEQLGTGHAVRQALGHVPRDAMVLILYGDVPLLRAESLEPLLAEARNGGLAVLTARLDNPSGYGRIVRDEGGKLTRIVEHKDASTAELAIGEVNTGIMAVSGEGLEPSP